MKEREIAGIKVFVSGEVYNKYKGTLQEQLEEKDKEIERLNKECDTYMKIATKRENIIDELEMYLKRKVEETIGNKAKYYDRVLRELYKLKEGKE